jgi:hypothetical protein
LTFYVNGADRATFSTTGNLLIGSTTDITGSGGLKVAGTAAANNTTSGALQVAGGGSVQGAWYVGGLISSGSNGLFGGALTVSGTGDNTFAGRLIATKTDAEIFTARSGNVSNYAAISVGRTSTETEWAVASSASQFAQGSAAGDAVLRTESTTRALFLDTSGGTNSAIGLKVLPNNGGVTVGSNLTVSGTGTSSFAGRLQIATLSVASTNASQIEVSSTDSASLPNAFPSLALGNTSNTANNYSYISFYGSAGASTTTSMIVGRTTNQASSYGQQEFQVRGASGFILAQKLTPTVADFTGITTSGTSTTAAAILGKSMGLTENLIVGGNIVVPQSPSKIDFGGTGANVLRANGAELQIGNTNGSSTGFNLKVIDQNSMAFQLQITGGSVFFDSAAGNINFRPGVATALTLAATSLNATFASTTEATTGGAGSLTTAGGIYAAKKIITASTLTTHGGRCNPVHYLCVGD